jgi:adenine-specific DNA-methyltransferase
MTNLSLPDINFIGNKQKLASWICDNFPTDAVSIFDAFAGSSSVGYEAKKRGLQVCSNDIMNVNYLISQAIIENKNDTLNDCDIDIIFNEKNIIGNGFMQTNYSNKVFFENECIELDTYRENILSLQSKYKIALAFTLIRRAMIRKMPYSRFNVPWEHVVKLRDEEYSYAKYKRRRAYHNKSFKEHFIENLQDYNNAVFDNNKNNISYNEDIFTILPKIKTDIIYLDPPYTGTMNNYFGFYGVIDEYIGNKQINAFENNFINKSKSIQLFDKLFANLGNYKYWILSYNNSSYPSQEELLSIIRKYCQNVKVIEKKHVYKVTGSIEKNKNKEYLFIAENK